MEQQPTNADIMAMLGEQQCRMARLEAENAGLKDNAQRVEAELKATTQRVEAENLELKAELERQRMEKVSLTSRVNEVEGGPAPQDKKLSRAGLFKAAAMGSAAVVGAGALSTLGTENAAASNTDTNFIAVGTATNYDALGTASKAFDSFGGTFDTGGYFRGTTYGAVGNGNSNSSSSIGLLAQGTQYGAKIRNYVGGSGVQIYLVPSSFAGSPTTGTHVTGEIFLDSAGRMYHCVTDGTPGTWVPMNALIPVPPVRVLDTRSGTRVGTSTGPFTTGSILTVPIAGQTFATSSGTFTFPSNTIGVAGNLIAVTPTGAGYLVAYPTGTTLPTAASVNFVPPGTGADIYYSLGNHITTALSASGQLNISVGLVAGANVQIVLDIAGYLV